MFVSALRWNRHPLTKVSMLLSLVLRSCAKHVLDMDLFFNTSQAFHGRSTSPSDLQGGGDEAGINTTLRTQQ